MAKTTRVLGLVISQPFRRDDGTWIGKWRKEDETTWHQRRLSGLAADATADDAHRALAAWATDHAFRLGVEAPRPATFGAFYRARLDALALGGSRSLAQYRLRWRVYMAPHFDALPWADLTPAFVMRWVEWLKTRPRAMGDGLLSPEWVHAIFSALSTACADAVALGHLTDNPCTRARRFLPARRATRARTKRQVLTVGEIARLLDQDFPRQRDLWRAEYALAFFCARRIGEVRALRIADVHLDAPTPYVRIERSWDHHTTKTGAALDVALHPQLVAILRDWIARGWAATMERDPLPTDRLFPHGSGEDQGRRAAADAIERHCTRAGLSPIVYHGLRHSGATAYLVAGVPEKIVQLGILGHVPQSVTARYLHPGLEDVGRWMRRLSVPIRGVGAPEFAFDVSPVVPWSPRGLDTTADHSCSLDPRMPNPDHTSVIHAVTDAPLARPVSTLPAPPDPSAPNGAVDLVSLFGDAARPSTPDALLLAQLEDALGAADRATLIPLLRERFAALALATRPKWTIVATSDADDAAIPAVAQVEDEPSARALLATMRGNVHVSIVLLSPDGEIADHATHYALDTSEEWDEDPERTAEHDDGDVAPDATREAMREALLETAADDLGGVP